jgi:hypothetical protein
MQSIPVGATGSFSIVVMPDHLASRFKDVTLPPVLATPARACSARAWTCVIWRRHRLVNASPAKRK